MNIPCHKFKLLFFRIFHYKFLRLLGLITVYFLIGTLAQATEGSLTFENKTLETTATLGAKEIQINFLFENKTNKAIEIERIEAPCSCLNTRLREEKKIYKAGEKGELSATLTIANLSGIVEKEVRVWQKGDPLDKPSHLLTIKMTIPELITIEPKSLIWKIGEDATAKSCKIIIHQEEPIKITEVTASNPAFQVELVALKEGQEYQLIVTPKETSVHTLGILNIKTDSKIMNYQSISAYATIKSIP